MSTSDDKQAERLRKARAKSPIRPFGPLEVAAVTAAQLHGAFVWLVVLAGLGGFRSQLLPGGDSELGGRVDPMGSTRSVLSAARSVDAT